MTQTPTVSIGMPVYNGERYLALAIESFLTQTFKDFELILCDNASTDRTEQICRRYAAQDGRVRYIRHPENVGPAGNYQRAFKLGAAPYFRWATYDDLSEPTSLARCVEMLDRVPDAVLAYPRTKLIDGEGHLISEHADRLHLDSDRPSTRFIQFFERVSMCNPVYGLIRRDILERTALIGDFVASDKPLLAELTLYGKFIEIPEGLFCRRIHQAAYSSAANVQQMMAWYDPKGKRRFSFKEWRHYRQYVQAVLRAPIAAREKLIALRLLVRLAVWGRQELLGELAQAIKQIMRSSWTRTAGSDLDNSSSSHTKQGL